MNLLDAALMTRGTWHNTGPDEAPFLPLAAEHCSLSTVLDAAFARRASRMREPELRLLTLFLSELSRDDNR